MILCLSEDHKVEASTVGDDVCQQGYSQVSFNLNTCTHTLPQQGYS